MIIRQSNHANRDIGLNTIDTEMRGWVVGIGSHHKTMQCSVNRHHLFDTVSSDPIRSITNFIIIYYHYPYSNCTWTETG